MKKFVDGTIILKLKLQKQNAHAQVWIGEYGSGQENGGLFLIRSNEVLLSTKCG